MPDETTNTLSKAVRQQIDEWAKKYPQDKKQSAVLYALRIVQEENGGHFQLNGPREKSVYQLFCPNKKLKQWLSPWIILSTALY